MSERGTLSLSIPHSTCSSFDMGICRSRFTGATKSMYGDSSWSSKYSPTRSRSTLGANGRNPSRNLIFRFIRACIFGERGSPRILRLPNARGPNSIRP